MKLQILMGKRREPDEEERLDRSSMRVGCLYNPSTLAARRIAFVLLTT